MDKSTVCIEDRAGSLHFTKWIVLANLRLADVPEHGGYPGLAAVYALRDMRDGDILKYGCTGDLRGRIFGNYIGGVGGATTERIHNELFRNKHVSHVEIAWIVTESPAVANIQEKQFRAEYKKRVGRLPQWDLVN
jgi:hypothetical protein